MEIKSSVDVCRRSIQLLSPSLSRSMRWVMASRATLFVVILWSFQAIDLVGLFLRSQFSWLLWLYHHDMMFLAGSFTRGGVHHRGLRLYRFTVFLASSLVRTKVGISIWDPGGFQFAEFLLFCKAVQSDLFHRSQDHDNSSVSVVGNYLWDATKWFLGYASRYLVVAHKFRLWFYFLFSWVILELDWFYWSQWQYLPEFFCWLTTVMHGVCIVLGFESSIGVLDLDSSIRSLVWSVLLLHRMPILRIVILI